MTNLKRAWHNEPHLYHVDAKDGDIVTISFMARKHHPRWSDLHKFYHLNFHLLFCVLIITFFVSYKLVSYVSQIKIVEKNSCIDIIFLTLFFILLFVPMSRLYQGFWLPDENRTAAPYKPLFSEHRFNQHYGTHVESWFNDRFLGRRQLMRLNNGFLKLNRVITNQAGFFDTKTNWIFDAGQVKQPVFRNYNQALLNSLEKFHSYLLKNNIMLYLLIVPSKTDIYAEFVPGHQKIPSIQNEVQIRYLEKKASFPVIFPIVELRQAAQKDYVYFKTEHHWTEWGAFIGYQALMQHIRKDFPDIHVVGENEYDIFYNNRVRGDWERAFTSGHTFFLMNIPYDTDKLLDSAYKYYTHKNEIIPDIVDIPHRKIKLYKHPKKGGSYKAFLSGTSMNENLLQFIPYSFQQLDYYRLNNVKEIQYQDCFKIKHYYENDILKIQPDIFILTITSENLPELLKLMKD